jgi:hypothetical protein
LVDAGAHDGEERRVIGLLDVSPPSTKSAEALTEYRRAMADLRDAVLYSLTMVRSSSKSGR